MEVRVPGTTARTGAFLTAACLACAEQGAPDDVLPADGDAAPAAVVDTAARVSPFVPRDSVVFVFEVSEHEYVSFEPLFQLEADTMSDALPEQGTPEGDLLERLWYAPGTKYHAFSGGAHVGVIELDGAALAGCTGLPGDASFVQKVPAVPLRGLAFAREPAGRDFLAEPTADEDSVAREAVVERLRSVGVPDSALAELDWQPVRVVLTPDGGRTTLASAEVYAFADAEQPAAGFVMIEADVARGAAVMHAVDGRSMEGGRTEFFDAEDLDGDGSPEIVLRNTYYESWDYTIHRRVAGRWQRLFKGGSSGC